MDPPSLVSSQDIVSDFEKTFQSLTSKQLGGDNGRGGSSAPPTPGLLTSPGAPQPGPPPAVPSDALSTASNKIGFKLPPPPPPPLVRKSVPRAKNYVWMKYVGIGTVIVVLLAIVAIYVRKRIFIRTVHQSSPSMNDKIENDDEKPASNLLGKLFPRMQKKKGTPPVAADAADAAATEPKTKVKRVSFAEPRVVKEEVVVPPVSVKTTPLDSSSQSLPERVISLAEPAQTAGPEAERLAEPPLPPPSAAPPPPPPPQPEAPPASLLPSEESDEVADRQMDPSTNPLLVAKRSANRDPNFTPVNLDVATEASSA